MKNFRIKLTLLLVILLGLAEVSAAGEHAYEMSSAISTDVDGQLKLEAHALPQAKLFSAISDYAGVKIHTIALPDARITATCSARNIETLISCAVGQASLVFVYPEPVTSSGSRSLPNEVWILGHQADVANAAGINKSFRLSSNAGADEQENVSAAAMPPHIPDLNQQAKTSVEDFMLTQNAHPDDWADVLPAASMENLAADSSTTPMLIELANSAETIDRVQALTRLGTEGASNDPGLGTLLEVALNDVHSEVRAQAVHALVRRGHPRSSEIIEAALRDENPDVRLMAVENTGNDIKARTLLRRAVEDADETVRALATIKLNENISQAPSTQATMH